MRIGFGYDIHRLKKDRALMIGCVRIPHPLGEDGHSDGDVLVHALIDALLGAAAAGDIGTHFPPEEAEWKDASGRLLLRRTAELIAEKGFFCEQADTVVIIEEPRLRPYMDEIRGRLAEVLKIPAEQISVKAKTKEGCGEVGAGKAVEAYAVVVLEKK